MPIRRYLGLVAGVIFVGALTVALAHWAGAMAALAPIALILALAARRRG